MRLKKMKFGKPKENIPKTSYLTIPVGVDGVGSEQHPNIKKTMDGYDNFRDELYERVVRAVKGADKQAEIIAEEKRKPENIFKYLINLLSNKRRKTRLASKKHSLKAKLANWWRKETTNDSTDLIKFVLIHGLLGAPALLMLLTISPVDFILLTIIRNSIWLTLLIYITGAGCLYYLFLDLNKALKDNWKKNRTR